MWAEFSVVVRLVVILRRQNLHKTLNAGANPLLIHIDTCMYTENFDLFVCIIENMIETDHMHMMAHTVER